MFGGLWLRNSRSEFGQVTSVEIADGKGGIDIGLAASRRLIVVYVVTNPRLVLADGFCQSCRGPAPVEQAFFVNAFTDERA